jgi:hypothetical protein
MPNLKHQRRVPLARPLNAHVRRFVVFEFEPDSRLNLDPLICFSRRLQRKVRLFVVFEFEPAL